MVPLHVSAEDLPEMVADLRAVQSIDGAIVTVLRKTSMMAHCERAVLDAGLVARAPGAGRDDGHGVMLREVEVVAVDHGIEERGVRDPGLEVVGYELAGYAAQVGEEPHVGGEPVLGGLRPSRLGEEVARVRQAGGEHRGGASRACAGSTSPAR